MIDKLKLFFFQSMMISFGIIVGMTIEAVFYKLLGEEFRLEWYHLVSIVVAGFACAWPALLKSPKREFSRNKFYLYIVIHFFLLMGEVVGIGYLFNWYRHWDGLIFVVADYILIYIFVWAVSAWMGFIDQKKINAALDEIRDEE